MSFLIPLLLFGWPLLTVALFATVHPRLAVVISYFGAMMFLPQAEYEFAGLPEYNKHLAASLGVLLGMLIFRAGHLARYRPSLLDVPMLIWCVAPMGASLSNDLGIYDGLSQISVKIILWGMPYFIGRIYFSDRAGMLFLAKSLVIGGLIYVPFCLWEVRMSPQLHRTVYGYFPHEFYQHVRGEGYRPLVFMQHSLMVGFWLASAAISCAWLAGSGTMRRLLNVPAWWWVPVLLVTLVLCKTSGALTLTLVAILIMFGVHMTRSAVPLAILLAVLSIYPALRVTGALEAERITNFASVFYAPDRIESLNTRLTSEDLTIESTRERMLFGWGGHGRSTVRDERGRRLSIPDALWFIALGQTGLVGLVGLMLMFLVQSWLLIWRVPARRWLHPREAPMLALGIILMLYWGDNLLNSMLNPVHVMAIGGMYTAHQNAGRRRKRTAARAPDQVALASKRQLATEDR